MRLGKIFIGAVLFCCLLAGAPRTSAAADDPSSFISDLGAQALEIIRSPDKQDQRKTEFSRLFASDFDVPAIGRFVLGRYWRTATPEQQNLYLDLFGRYVISIYSDRFSSYSGEGFEVLGSQPGQGGVTSVNSQITRPNGGKPIRIDWVVVQDPAGFKITDVVVEGVSMSVTQRQEFASIISQNGGNLQALIDLLQKKADGS